MRPMLAPSFRKRVKMIPESKVSKYLMDVPDLSNYLPDDMKTGKANTCAMVQDFISYRQYVEQQLSHHGSTGDGHSDGKSVVSSSHQSSDHYRSSDSGASFGLCWNSTCESDSAAASHSLHSSGSGLSLIDVDEDDADEEASIHCDISDEEHDDVKQSAAATNEMLSRSAEFQVYETAS
eukprot:Sro505_g156210.3  (179) ;mRNA; r:48009-48545